ncbi:MAG: apolipoprotein N-acyltransferase [Nitriliruptorales bacterium]|nr:apolipoprotein N-acyltransferase [Nitriliruptorales bacterium]
MLAVGGGIALHASFPPLRAWPLVMLVPVAWIAALRAAGGERPFLIGFTLGVAGYGPMLTWIAAPAGLLAWVLLVVVQAAFVGLASVLVRPWLRSPGWPLLAALAWTGVDFVRSWVPLNGFEWGALQYAHVDGSWLLPLARLGGGRAVTFATVAVACAFLQLAIGVVGGRSSASAGTRQRSTMRTTAAPAAVVIAVLVLPLVVPAAPTPSGESIDVLVAQGNDLEETELSPRDVDRVIAANLLGLTREAIGSGPVPDLVVWPENAFDRDPWAAEGNDLAPIKDEAGALTHGRLLAGVNRVGPRDRTFENSMVLVGEDGAAADVYVKQHYVPFGEYVPWRSVLGDFPPLRQVPRDGVSAPVTDSIHVGEARVAVAICFESLFGRLLRDNIRAGDELANVVVVSTSDSTFGRTGEPEQHLSQSRMRAVESGRWIIHAASSGVTTLIAPDGTVGERSQLFTQTTQRHEVPLVEGTTPWLRWGDVLDIPLAIGLAGLAYSVLRRRRDRSTPVAGG